METNISNWIRSVVDANLAGQQVAIPSICSAHPDVVAAAMLAAQDHGQPILIEATSNQVNQFGGYTGMQAEDFVRFIGKIAKEVGFDSRRIAFGGDHLGPQAWRREAAETAMRHAEILVASYVRAGITKIHLDCSEGCAGEPAQLDDSTVAGRAARLAAICEAEAPDPKRLCYVIGTEVPVPGGARTGDDEHLVRPTDADAAARTLAVHKHAFLAAGLPDAWDRVIATVVQPGLEFGPTRIDHFDMSRPDHLSAALSDSPGIAFEAHSTDFQRAEVFAELARRHFAVLKVGPALSFAYRKAIYALDQVDAWYSSRPGQDRVPDVLERLMVSQDGHWRSHLTGGPEELHILRHFSWADRIRYYWGDADAKLAVVRLQLDVDRRTVASSLLDQYFDQATLEMAERLRQRGKSTSTALLYAQIRTALEPYFHASAA